jgi:hypothetical protein
MAINYLFILLLSLVALYFVYQVIWLLIPLSRGEGAGNDKLGFLASWGIAFAFTTGGYWFVTKLLKSPVNFNINLDVNLISAEKNDLDRLLGRFLDRGAMSQYINSAEIYLIRVKKFVGFLPLLNQDETKYLNNFLQLCALRDAFEVMYINNYIDNTRMKIFKAKFLKYEIQHKLAELICSLLDKVRTEEELKLAFMPRVAEWGLTRYIDFTDSNFFSKPYKSLYEERGIDGVASEIEKSMGDFYQKKRDRFFF